MMQPTACFISVKYHREREKEREGAGLEHGNTPPLKSEIRVKIYTHAKILATFCNIHTLPVLSDCPDYRLKIPDETRDHNLGYLTFLLLIYRHLGSFIVTFLLTHK